MFIDESVTKKCPKTPDSDIVCRRSLVYQALHGVELSYDSTFKLDNIINDICDFCIKQNNGR